MIFALLFLPVAVAAWVFLAPALDRAFAVIWREDDGARSRALRRRLEELRRSGIGEEAALTIAAREAHVTERQVKEVLGRHG